jgi:prephenate dehydrogenase
VSRAASRRAPGRVAIVGLGLMGGSLGRALVRAGVAVVGLDRPEVLARARRAGAIGVAARSLADALRQADLVVLAAPPRANLRLLRRLARFARPGLVVTDLTSVKAPLGREARRLGLADFVGGHPMTGAERGGFAASRADLYAGRPYLLVPGAASRRALARVRALARAAGARPVVALDAREHDRVVAFLSHVPQLVAWALADAAGKDVVARGALRLQGPAFASMTRLARSPEGLWREILELNAREVRRALRAFERELLRRSRAVAR